MNSSRFSSLICPVRVSHWIAAIHSASVSRTSRAKSCRWRTSACMSSASRGSRAVPQRAAARSVMFSSVTSCISTPFTARPAAARRPRPWPASCPRRTPAGRYFIPQSGASTSRSRRPYGQRPADPLGDDLGGLDLGRRQVEHAEDDRLVGQVGQHAEVEAGLRRLDRDLVARAVGELGQERVARRPLVDDRRVAEAQVHRGRAVDAVQRPVERREPVRAGRLRAGLQVGLVELDDVGARREQVLDLRVHGLGVGHRGRLERPGSGRSAPAATS